MVILSSGPIPPAEAIKAPVTVLPALKCTDPAGNPTDILGRGRHPIRTDLPTGSQIKMVRDELGLLLSRADENGDTMTWEI